MTRHVFSSPSSSSRDGCAATTQSHLPGPPPAPLSCARPRAAFFETPDPRLVLKARSTCPGSGFVIRHADAELGLVTAVTEWRSGSRTRASDPEVGRGAADLLARRVLLPLAGRSSPPSSHRERHAGGRAAPGCASSLVAKITDKEGNVRA